MSENKSFKSDIEWNIGERSSQNKDKDSNKIFLYR